MADKLIEATKKGEEKKVQYKPLNSDPTLRKEKAVLDPMKELDFKGELHPEEDESVQLGNQFKENHMTKLNGKQKVRDDWDIIMTNG